MGKAEVASIVLGMVLMSVIGIGAERVQHLVGGDRGWDASNDLPAWSSSRIFRLGDSLWFTYSRAEGMIAELKSKEEYESCDVQNPIKMYTDGLNSIKLEEKGIRYFVSTNPDHCKSGLKLHVEVSPEAGPSDFPKVITSESEALALAAGPTPSGSTHLASTLVSMIAGVLVFCSFIISV